MQMVFVSQSCLLLISGVFYPVEVMPGWMQAISRLSPATYALVAVREALLRGASIVDLGHVLLPLLLVGLGTIPAGLLVFGWAERYAKRTGRLKRNVEPSPSTDSATRWPPWASTRPRLM